MMTHLENLDVASLVASLQEAGAIQVLGDADLGTSGWMLTPADTQQVAQLLYLAQQQEQPLAIAEFESRQLSSPVWLNLSRMDRLRKYRKADLTLTVESGITFGALMGLIHAEGHDFALHYPRETLLIDILAEDRPALETGFRGYPRDYVLGLEFVTPDGQISRCGSEVVKNATGYDLNKLYVGSFNSLGVISAVTLKLMALKEGTRSWLFEFDDIHQGFQTIARLLKQPFPYRHCELYHRDRLGTAQHAKTVAPWQLLVEMGEDNALLKHITPLMRDLVVSPESESSLHPARESSLFQRLSTWTAEELVVEVALPVHAVSATMEDFYFRLTTLFRQPDLFPVLQMRPAAGLVYLIWPPSRLPEPASLEAVLLELRQQLKQNPRWGGGFLRMAQFPQPFQGLASYFNLPEAPGVRRLMERCKASYDPNGVLYSSRLPLSGQEGGKG